MTNWRFRHQRPRFHIFWAAVLVCLSAACSWREVRESPPADRLPEELARLTPDGWSLYDEIREYSPGNLYEIINGRAEFYLAYDVVRMTYASFEKHDSGRFVDVFVFEMGTPTHAFGVLSGERSMDAASLDVGRDAYRLDANYYVWKGRYYIQIIASDTTEEFRRIGSDMAHAVIDLVSDSGEPVWGLDALPRANRVPNSEQYFLVDAMGLDFMENTYTARYTRDGAVLTAFLSKRDSQQTAGETVGRYIEHAGRYGEGVKHDTVDGVELVCCDMGNEYDVIFQNDGLVGGITAAADRKLAVQAAADLCRALRNIKQ